ncbi:iron dicitrate transport regulator FecR [Achromobacter sp. HZ01]|uniref:FecR domain-containing protein n=1 Tax=Achromobacter sp. HZ01 TaxID=1416886 RepID=UPI000DC4F416|nr:FecR domain-containing protein [Achromobacter sp. HZ01]RAP64790.1 iron dicitrate transport regulator FecR [Achromobacter sp. HZ01]
MADQVINWLLLLRSGQATAQDYSDFLAWRAADPAHETAWQQLTGTLEGSSFGRLGDAYPAGYASAGQAAAPALLAPSPAPIAPPRRRFLAGALALAGTGACAAYVGNAFYPLGNVAADAATATGERRRYVLSDGSQLLLDARSRVNLDFTPAYRQVHLLDGAVTVSVAPDARRPFLVHTAQGTVRALGTRYMVRQQAQRTLVVVHEHEVEVETMSGAHGTVRAGTGARFDASRMDTPRAELMAEAAWEAGWVEARGRPLAEVIAALRPYRSGTLRVSMAAGGLPVSGHFPLDDTDAALDTLRDMMPINVRRFTPWFVSINVAA